MEVCTTAPSDAYLSGPQRDSQNTEQTDGKAALASLDPSTKTSPHLHYAPSCTTAPMGCVFKGMSESNQGNNGRLNREQQCRNHTHPSTHTHTLTHRRVNQFQRHSIPTHSSECMNFSRPPGHPPPNLYMMDYHHSQPHRDGDCEREREVEEGWGGGGGQSLQGHSHQKGALG